MSKNTKSYYISEHAHAWALATGNASTYVEALLGEAEAAFIDAHMHLEGFTRAAVMAVMDVLNGHLFTPGMGAADEIRISLDDAPELRTKWGVSEDEWTRLLTMDDRTGEAFKVLAREFWQGRRLP